MHVILTSAAREKTQVVHDVATDPTLPRTRAKCPKCVQIVEAVYFQVTALTRCVLPAFSCFSVLGGVICRPFWR